MVHTAGFRAATKRQQRLGAWPGGAVFGANRPAFSVLSCSYHVNRAAAYSRSPQLRGIWNPSCTDVADRHKSVADERGRPRDPAGTHPKRPARRARHVRCHRGRGRWCPRLRGSLETPASTRNPDATSRGRRPGPAGSTPRSREPEFRSSRWFPASPATSPTPARPRLQQLLALSGTPSAARSCLRGRSKRERRWPSFRLRFACRPQPDEQKRRPCLPRR